MVTIHSAADACPAVVLRTRPLGESDLLVVLLTPEHGKVEAAARSARNSRRRFPGGLPAGLRGRAAIARGRGALARLERFEPTSDHTPVGRDLERFAYVAYLCELTDELVRGQHPDAPVFAVLCTALEAVIGGPPRPAELRRFELVLLGELGLLPALAGCCVCGAEVRAGPDGTLGFDAGRGGLLCGQHAVGAPRVDEEVVAVMRSLAAGGPTEGLEEAPADVRRSLRDLSQAALKAHLRRPLQSLAFFSAIPRAPATRGEAG
ncbi:MAG: DNA repair protein RecO [Myxococcales bacterium]|nr:DNA repair protein RecO [Myxococcales bacterium]